MKTAFRLLLALMFTLALPFGAACGGTSTPTAASHTSAGSSDTKSKSGSADSSGSSSSSAAQSNPSGTQLDPAVSMPSNFPHDFPIYRGARLTQQGQYSSGGKSTWAMTWETLDALEPVGKWYETQFNQGDWTVTFSGSSSNNYSMTFNRKSNNNDGGLLGVSDGSGYTKIDVVFGIG